MEIIRNEREIEKNLFQGLFMFFFMFHLQLVYKLYEEGTMGAS